LLGEVNTISGGGGPNLMRRRPIRRRTEKATLQVSPRGDEECLHAECRGPDELLKLVTCERQIATMQEFATRIISSAFPGGCWLNEK
jgi:hypothetical protein